MSTARYLLDTDTCIYLIKNKPPAVARKLAKLPAGHAGISVVTYGELWRGVQKSQQVERNAEALAALVTVLPVQPLAIEAGLHYGDIRATLERAGKPIGNNDLWIAAHARAMGWTLVTNNEREFSRVSELRLQNWAR